MRALLALLLVAAVIAPGVLADEATEEAPLQPMDHPDDADHDSPGIGVVALVGIAAGAAILRRRS